MKIIFNNNYICNHPAEKCDKRDGSCLCKDGWMGEKCDQCELMDACMHGCMHKWMNENMHE